MASLSSYGTRNSSHSQLVFQWALVGLCQARVYQGRKFWLCRRNHFTHGSVQQLENTQTRPRTCSSGLHKDWCDLPAGVTFWDTLPNLNYGLLKEKMEMEYKRGDGWHAQETVKGFPNGVSHYPSSCWRLYNPSSAKFPILWKLPSCRIDRPTEIIIQGTENFTFIFHHHHPETRPSLPRDQSKDSWLTASQAFLSYGRR